MSYYSSNRSVRWRFSASSDASRGAWAICLDGMCHHVSWSDPEELARQPRWEVFPPMGFVKGQLMLRTDLFNLLHLLAGIPVEDRIEE